LSRKLIESVVTRFDAQKRRRPDRESGALAVIGGRYPAVGPETKPLEAGPVEAGVPAI